MQRTGSSVAPLPAAYSPLLTGLRYGQPLPIMHRQDGSKPTGRRAPLVFLWVQRLQRVYAQFGLEYCERVSIAASMIKLHDVCGAEDAALVVQEMVKLPLHILKTLQRDGVKMVVTRGSITTYIPELITEKPTGWSDGSTWENVPGVYLSHAKEVVIATRITDDGILYIPEKDEDHDCYNLVLHEFLHAYAPYFIYTESFNRARNAHLEHLHEYYLQAGYVGSRETFAEMGAQFFGGDPTLKTRLSHLYRYFEVHHRAPAKQTGSSRVHM